MNRHPRAVSELLALFVEALLVALAEAVVAAAGWLLRKLWRRLRRREGDE